MHVHTYARTHTQMHVCTPAHNALLCQVIARKWWMCKLQSYSIDYLCWKKSLNIPSQVNQGWKYHSWGRKLVYKCIKVSQSERTFSDVAKALTTVFHTMSPNSKIWTWKFFLRNLMKDTILNVMQTDVNTGVENPSWCLVLCSLPLHYLGKHVEDSSRLCQHVCLTFIDCLTTQPLKSLNLCLGIESLSVYMTSSSKNICLWLRLIGSSFQQYPISNHHSFPSQ